MVLSSLLYNFEYMIIVEIYFNVQKCKLMDNNNFCHQYIQAYMTYSLIKVLYINIKH